MNKLKPGITAAVISVFLLSACSEQESAKEGPTPDAAKSETEAMPSPAPDASMSNMEEMAQEATPAKQEHTAMGVVTALDPAAGTATIKHDAVESAGWPAMTMAFKVDPTSAANLKPNTHVQFKFKIDGSGSATVTSIEPMSEMNH